MIDLIGKKLIWAGVDTDTNKTYYVFEGMAAIVLEDCAIISDATSAMKAILSESSKHAENIMALKALLEGSKDGAKPGVLKAADSEASKA